MKYTIKMSDLANDKAINIEVDAESVFDAIDIAANALDDPNEVELIEAIPIH